MLRNELWKGRVKSVGQKVIGWVVEGHWVCFAIACLGCERQPVGNEVAPSFKVLGTGALLRLSGEACNFACDELDRGIIGGFGR
jgi:hypothetical protein